MQEANANRQKYTEINKDWTGVDLRLTLNLVFKILELSVTNKSLELNNLVHYRYFPYRQVLANEYNLNGSYSRDTGVHSWAGVAYKLHWWKNNN